MKKGIKWIPFCMGVEEEKMCGRWKIWIRLTGDMINPPDEDSFIVSHPKVKSLMEFNNPQDAIKYIMERVNP